MSTKTSERATENVTETVALLKQIAHIPNRMIGDALGLSENVTQQRMTGISKWTVGELYVLADFFGVPIDLFYEQDQKAAATRAISEYDITSLRFRKRASDQAKASSGCIPVTAGQRPRAAKAA